MTDDDLTKFLGLTPAEAEVILPTLTQSLRQTYERLHDAEMAIRLWQQGVAPLPKGIIVLPDRGNE
jgi:hypothetical protein